MGEWLCSELQLGTDADESSGSVHCHVKQEVALGLVTKLALDKMLHPASYGEVVISEKAA